MNSASIYPNSVVLKVAIHWIPFFLIFQIKTVKPLPLFYNMVDYFEDQISCLVEWTGKRKRWVDNWIEIWKINYRNISLDECVCFKLTCLEMKHESGPISVNNPTWNNSNIIFFTKLSNNHMSSVVTFGFYLVHLGHPCIQNLSFEWPEYNCLKPTRTCFKTQYLI